MSVCFSVILMDLQVCVALIFGFIIWRCIYVALYEIKNYLFFSDKTLKIFLALLHLKVIKFFSCISGQFPGEHGLVAPGMSCHYGIRFAPDSLMDYDDEIRIQTQSSQPIIIPLQGRRQPPLISCKKCCLVSS